MNNELRKLTKTIKNPLRDKRCKYGIESVDAFPAEARFVVRDGADGKTISFVKDEKPVAGRQPIYVNSSIIQKELVAEIVENSEPVEAETLAEVVADVYGSHIVIAEEVINRLIREGKVQIADVRDAVNATLDEDA